MGTPSVTVMVMSIGRGPSLGPVQVYGYTDTIVDACQASPIRESELLLRRRRDGEPAEVAVDGDAAGILRPHLGGDHHLKALIELERGDDGRPVARGADLQLGLEDAAGRLFDPRLAASRKVEVAEHAPTQQRRPHRLDERHDLDAVGPWRRGVCHRHAEARLIVTL